MATKKLVSRFKDTSPPDFCNLPVMGLAEYVKACHGGQPVPAIIKYCAKGELQQALSEIAALLHAWEPLSAVRPDACAVRSVFDKVVEIEPATIDADGKITPRDKRLLTICAPMGQAVVVDVLRALPANLTAQESGQVVWHKMQIMGFTEGFCPIAEPDPESEEGTFSNTEHIILCPGSGFDLFGRNSDPYSNALISVHAELWASC